LFSGPKGTNYCDVPLYHRRPGHIKKPAALVEVREKNMSA
jgi:hypothetical protein